MRPWRRLARNEVKAQAGSKLVFTLQHAEPSTSTIAAVGAPIRAPTIADSDILNLRNNANLILGAYKEYCHLRLQLA